MGLHKLFQPLVQYMCIDLGRRDIGVAKHLLHRAQIGTIGQQMACESMSQRVRRNT